MAPLVLRTRANSSKIIESKMKTSYACALEISDVVTLYSEYSSAARVIMNSFNMLTF